MSERSEPTPIHELHVILAVRSGAEAMAFYTHVFGARETMRLTEPSGRIAHAELQLDGVTLMLADERPEDGFLSPLAFGGSGTLLHLHVANVDSIMARALEAGATVLRPAADEGHGERQAKFRDPFGHEWLLGHQLEKLSDEEIQRRFEREQATQ